MNKTFKVILQEKLEGTQPLPKRNGYLEFTCPFCGGKAWRRKTGHDIQGRCESRRCWRIKTD